MLVVNRVLIEVKHRLQELEASAKEHQKHQIGLIKEIDNLANAIRSFEEYYYASNRTNNLDTSSLRDIEHSSELGTTPSGS